MKHNEEVLRDRVKYHFMLKGMRAALKVDLITAQDPEVKSKLKKEQDFEDDGEAWSAFEDLSNLLFGITRISSQLLMAVALVRKNASGPIFVLICALQPLLQTWVRNNVLWRLPRVIYCIEHAFNRMAALHQLTYADQFRVDRLNDGAGGHIEKEFIKQRHIVGDKCTQAIGMQLVNRESLFYKVLISLSRDIPLLAFAAWTFLDAKSISITSFLMMQQTSETVGWTFYLMSRRISRFAKALDNIKKIYKLASIENVVKDGKEAYPLETNLVENGAHGAQIEFRNVSFVYPGTSKNALTDVSFSIKPGQLAVIVGTNGSGKSSLVKLFNRLYDPSAGCVLLDGLPLAEYRLADVRAAMAMLRQDHAVYPLSLRENIAFGLPGHAASEEDVWDAARQGGAADFVEKLENGMETVLQPVDMASAYFPDEAIPELKALLDDKEKTTNISGGESQRLAASRTFMRLSGGNIRFLAADEPTSALDPEGELALFSRLRALRGGKTVVFVTHRFGHLTRYADVILCMKEGRLVEQGTHEELLAKGGEYFRLHNVQAQAFVR
ncbi:P-loop containing nucleoside triphosphate hydrolase protein [Phellopilus nigrolimitatus]|nr:P-loop containing nucleoside triphosphate hydrolase protein [Phellopilus nigrolimitatus]